MLEIIVNKKYNLHLPEGIELSFIEENPLLLTDRIPSSYTMSFEIEPTAYNLKAFGFPSRITSASVKLKVLAEIRHSGLVMAVGEIILLETEYKLKLQFKGSRESNNLRAEMHRIDIGSYSYGQFPKSPEELDYTDEMFSQYTQSMYTIAHTAFPYAIAPVAIQNKQWDGLENRNGFINTYNKYINYWNPTTADFYFEDGTAGVSRAYTRTPILPFPYVKDIIDAAFGALLESNPFSEGDLAKLLLITMNHKYNSAGTLLNMYSLPGPAGRRYPVMFPLVDSYEDIDGLVPLSWEMKSFMQHFLFANFLKDLMKIFCMTTFPGMKYRIEFNNNVMSWTERVNWDDKMAGTPIITREEAKLYVFKYNGVERAGTEVVSNKYPHAKAIFDAAMANTEDDNSIIYEDETSGAQYSITRTLRGLDSLVFLTSEVKNDPLASAEPAGTGEKYEVSSNVRPATMNFLDYWDKDITGDIIPRKYWFVPQLNNNGIEAAPYIMFWGGFRNTFENTGVAYPCLMAHHTDHFGVKRFNTSLHPEGADGLIEKFHGKMKEWVEKDKMKVRAAFRLTLLDIKKLQIWVKISLRGRLFYIEKMSYTISKTGISLVDVDLIEC